MRNRLLVAFFLMLAIAGRAHSADTSTFSKATRFAFDKKVAKKVAIDALETDFRSTRRGDAASPRNDPKVKFDIKNPEFFTNIVTDCKKKKRQMVIVAFREKEEIGVAWVQLFLMPSGGFERGETGEVGGTPAELFRDVGGDVECGDD